MNEMRSRIFSFLVAGFLVIPVQSAWAGMFAADGLSKAFCDLKTVRQTALYIDASQMRQGQTDWAVKISDKLRATLMPGEPVSVIRLNSDLGTSEEIWHACWPNYTDQQKSAIEGQSYIFQASPLKELEGQQAFFLRDMSVAFTKIYSEGISGSKAAEVILNSHRQSQIVRALASDEGRFAHSLTTIRVIIYSDMLENSDLGSVYVPSADGNSVNLSSKLGSHLRRAVVYAFGIGGDGHGAGEVQEKAKLFWEGALKDFSAVLGGFGADLSVSNQIPVAGYDYDLSTEFRGEKLFGKMSLLVDRDGNLIDSWMGFNRLTIAGLSGSFRCAGNDCDLDAETTSGITILKTNETIAMSGVSTKLSGSLGLKGTNSIFDVMAVAAK